MIGRTTLGTVMLLALGSAATHAQEAPIETNPERAIALPSVPADVDPRRAASKGSGSRKVADTLQTITVEPGVNEIIQIAVGHPNRIVTPFKAPRVVTTAAASVETSANVIYVAPSGPALITMFLTETGDESVSISLTLQPRQIPPRELRLELPAGVFLPKTVRDKRPHHAAKDRTYVARAGAMFDQLARGQVPLDAAFSDQAPPPYPLCAVENGFEVSFATGQYLLAESMEVYVGLVRHGGDAAVAFQEPCCYSEGVVAVALWPSTRLAPGEFAEIYLARALAAPEPSNSQGRRPSLLRGIRP
jgi:conjugal transfer pilus assembly protein TraK